MIFEDATVVLKAVAEETRLRILALLAEHELTVSDLTEILRQSQPRISRHLRLLAEVRLVERFREGSWAFSVWPIRARRLTSCARYLAGSTVRTVRSAATASGLPRCVPPVCAPPRTISVSTPSSGTRSDACMSRTPRLKAR